MYRMVFTQVVCRLVILLLCSVLLSCSAYRIIEIETLQPARLTLKPWDRIGLLDRNASYTTNPLKNIDAYEELSKSNLLDQFAAGMKEILMESEHSDSVVLLIQEAASVLARPSMPPPYAEDSIRKLCDRFHLKYIVAIEISYYDWEAHQLSYNWLIRLYSKEAACPLDSVVLKYVIEEDPEELWYTLPWVTLMKGAEYARRIVPYWQNEERRIYNSGRVLRLGDAFLKEGQTDKAMQVWEGAQNLSDKIALKASVNLAWVYENAGDYEQALAILNDARQRIKKMKESSAVRTYTEEYMKLLEERIRKSRLLEQQFPKEEE